MAVAELETIQTQPESVNIEELKLQALRGLNALYGANTAGNKPNIELIQQGIDALAKLGEKDRNDITSRVNVKNNI